MKIKVINLHKESGIEYGLDYVYIGRPTKWGNPYEIGEDGTREEVIVKYIDYLYESGLYKDIMELDGKILGCWCKPKHYHGDELIRYLKAIRAQKGVYED